MPAHNGSQRAEQRKLRERMRGLGMTYGEIAAEMARRYKLRPRAAWRIAWGAALPTALVAPGAVSDGRFSPATGTGFFLARCAASLASCWHLLRGSDLPAVERFLSAYLLPLEGIAQQPSRYQMAAARLATQAHRICGILALHRNQLSVREHHCKRALQYAAISSDASSHASALISLASTYFYAADPQQAALEGFMSCGLDGIALLGSRQRLREMQAT